MVERHRLWATVYDQAVTLRPGETTLRLDLKLITPVMKPNFGHGVLSVQLFTLRQTITHAWGFDSRLQLGFRFCLSSAHFE